MKTLLTYKFIYLILCLFLFIGNKSLAQNQHFSCGPTVPIGNKINLTEYKKQRAIEMNAMKNGTQFKSSNEDSTYIIPIVFHIIHEYGSENISNAQILDAVQILNNDYQKLNADTSSVSSTFDTLIGNVNLEFRLAKIDPDGVCTNGIDRIFSHETTIGDDESKMNYWPRENYLNIWVVKSMLDGVAGYAYYPSATTQGFMGYVDGIIILNNYIGSIGTSSPLRSRALTHEIGHYLGLAHTWGSTNAPGVACGDDGINDTPETKGWDHCTTNGLDFCNPGIEENIQNYMEYSYCSHMFTKGQVFGMRSVLNSSIAMRNNLWSSSNLIASGVNNSSSTPCIPIADFYMNKNQICKGQTVNLVDNSFNGIVDTWSWSIQGGIPSTSSDQNPSITFNQGGWHNITLTVSNQFGTNTKTINNAIFVSESNNQYIGLAVENFESFNSNNLQNYYISTISGIENTQLPEVFFNQGVVNTANWELASDVGYSGTQSMRLDAFNSNGLMVDEFTTPSFDLTYVSSPQLTFKYSTAATTNVITNITETLKVYFSTNCGETWQQRASLDGLDLITAGFEGAKFKPTNINQWKTKTISLPSYLSTDNVKFKFEYTSGESSNDIYIDDIGIEGILGLSSQNRNNNLNIYPSPTSSISNVILEINSSEQDDVSIQLFNTVGQLIATKNNINLVKGINKLNLSDVGFETISTGVYLIKVNSLKKALTSSRIIIQ